MDLSVVIGMLGVVTAVVIGGWQIRLAYRRGHPESEASASAIRPDVLQTALTPESIIEQIRSLPLVQQTAARKSYVGLRVEWKTTLSAIHGHKKVVKLMLLDRGNYPWVYCKIDLSQHREIALAKEGQALLVRGFISRVGGNDIELENASAELQ